MSSEGGGSVASRSSSATSGVHLGRARGVDAELVVVAVQRRVVVEAVADERDREGDGRVGDVSADRLEPALARRADGACGGLRSPPCASRAVATTARSSGCSMATDDRTKYAIGPSGAVSMSVHVVARRGRRSRPTSPSMSASLRGEVVEESALRDAGGARGGVEGRRALAVVHEDPLEGVEHGVAGGWGAAHVLDRSERHPVHDLILYRLDGKVMEAEMTNTTQPATQPIERTTHAAARIDPGRAPRAPRRAWIALAVLMLPVLLVSVDNTVLSFALPAISRDLAPTAAQQLWIIDAYPLVLAGLLVGDGQRRRPLRPPPHAADRLDRLRGGLGRRRVRARPPRRSSPPARRSASSARC